MPRFCYHDQLTIAGNCRICLVELTSSIKPIIACATSAIVSLGIYTSSLLAICARESVLEFLLVNHPLDCPICDQGGECDLQDLSFIFGSDMSRFIYSKRIAQDQSLGYVVKCIMTRCIHCTRCVRYMDEIIGEPTLGTLGRGSNFEIGTFVDVLNINTVILGNIIDLCPVGALTSKPYSFTARPWELSSIESIDVLDSLCSNIRVDHRGLLIMRILPRLNVLVNDE